MVPNHNPQILMLEGSLPFRQNGFVMHRKLILLAVVLVATTPPLCAQAPKPAPGAFSRALEIQTASLSMRYRYIKNSQGVVTSDHLQHREVFSGRLKFDNAGRFSLNAKAASGSNFIGSWNNTGIGTGTISTNLHLEHLFLAAEPVKGMELQVGGMDVMRGENTEITSFDNDAYIVAERLRIRRPKDVFFDDIAVTFGFLGDTAQPDLRKRFHRLKQSNYHQFLVAKKLGKRAAVSMDYTFQSGAETLRESISVQTPELHFLDSVRVENYQRMDVRRNAGLAFTAEKKPVKKLTLSGGFARVDRSYGGLNADRMQSGNRLFFTGTVAVTTEFTVATFLTHTVGTQTALPIAGRYELVFAYNLLPGLKRTGLF